MEASLEFGHFQVGLHVVVAVSYSLANGMCGAEHDVFRVKYSQPEPVGVGLVMLWRKFDSQQPVTDCGHPVLGCPDVDVHYAYSKFLGWPLPNEYDVLQSRWSHWSVDDTVLIVLCRKAWCNHSTVVSNPIFLVFDTMCARQGVDGGSLEVFGLVDLGRGCMQTSHRKYYWLHFGTDACGVTCEGLSKSADGQDGTGNKMVNGFDQLMTWGAQVVCRITLHMVMVLKWKPFVYKFQHCAPLSGFKMFKGKVEDGPMNSMFCRYSPAEFVG